MPETVTAVVTVQPLPSVYVIVADPAPTAVTVAVPVPVLETVATVASLVAQVSPVLLVVVAESDPVADSHNVKVANEIVGAATTVTSVEEV